MILLATDEVPKPVPTPGEAARARQLQANLEGSDASGESEAAAVPQRRYKMGASTREEELQRKQIIGHIIPAGITAAAAVYASTHADVTLLPGVPTF